MTIKGQGEAIKDSSANQVIGYLILGVLFLCLLDAIHVLPFSYNYLIRIVGIELFFMLATILFYYTRSTNDLSSLFKPLRPPLEYLEFLYLYITSGVLILLVIQHLMNRPNIINLPHQIFAYLVLLTCITVLITRWFIRGQSILSVLVAVYFFFGSIFFSLTMDMSYKYYLLTVSFLFIALYHIPIIRGDKPPLLIPLAALAIAGLIGSLLGVSISFSMREYLRFLYCGGIFFTIWYLKDRREELNPLLNVIALQAIIIGIFGGYNFLSSGLNIGWRFAIRNRMWIMGIHPNALSSILILFLPLTFMAIFWADRKRSKIFFAVSTICALGCVVLTFSKGGLIGLGSGILFIAILYLSLKQGRELMTPRLAVSLAALLLTLAVIVPIFLSQSRWSREFITMNTLRSRFTIWRAILATIKDNPITGIGAHNNYYSARYAERIPLGEMEYFKEWMRWGVRGAHAHNTYLEIARSFGAIGFFALSLLLLAYVYHALRGIYRPDLQADRIYLALGALGAVVGLMVSSIIDYPFGFCAPALGFFSLLAITMRELYAAQSKHSNDDKHYYASDMQGYAVLFLVLFFIFRPWSADFLARGINELLPMDVDVRKRISFVIDPFTLFTKLAYAEEKLKDKEQSISGFKMLKSLLKYEPQNPFLIDKIGFAHYMMGEIEPALRLLKKAVKLDPYGLWNGDHYHRLAVVLAAFGRTDQAFDAIVEAIIRNPIMVTDRIWAKDKNHPASELHLSMCPDIKLADALAAIESKLRDLPPDSPQGKMLFNSLVKSYWSLERFDRLLDILDSRNLSYLVPIDRWKVMVKLILKPGDQPLQQRDVFKLLTEGDKYSHQESLRFKDKAIYSYLLATQIQPRNPAIYRRLADVTGQVEAYAKESRYFTRIYQRLSGEKSDKAIKRDER